MTDTYTITIPEITSVTLSPPTVDMLGKYTVTVTAWEKTVTLDPVWPYSGQIYSGQNTIYAGG